MIAYAVIAVLASVALWLALEWHRAKEERDDALTRLLETEADLDTLDWYAKRALEAEARVKELETQLSRYTISVPSCWVSEYRTVPGTLTVGGTGILDTICYGVQAVLPTQQVAQ